MGAKMAIMAIMVKMAIMALPSMVINMFFFVCPQKELPKCSAPVKTVLKKMDPMKSYDQNKKKLIKVVIFGQNPL